MLHRPESSDWITSALGLEKSPNNEQVIWSRWPDLKTKTKTRQIDIGVVLVEVFISKHKNLACRRNSTLLIISLTISSDSVGGPTSPGVYNVTSKDRDPCAIRVWCFGADFTDNFSGRYFFSPFKWNVLAFDDKEGVEACHSLFLWVFSPLPKPWDRRPILFVYDCLHTSLSLWWLRSWRHSMIFPDSSSKTGMAKFSINSDG